MSKVRRALNLLKTKVLNSKLRPKYWRRDFVKPSYNYQILGCSFEAKVQPDQSDVYNTTQKGFGNEGHYFGDKFTSLQSDAVS